MNQTERYIFLRNENPQFRIRSSDQLGPIVEISVARSREQGLEGPERYFVELAMYTELFGAPAKDIIENDEFDGTTLAGDAA
jgi:hypothetical protein